MNNDIAIQVKHVSKRFRHKQVLQDVSLTIEQNQIYGFSGPNGSGKSVLFKTILGFIRPNAGEVIVAGKVIRQDVLFAPNVGFAMQEYGVLPERTGLDNLKLLQALEPKGTETPEALLRYVGLDPQAKDKVKAYSLGMQQRLLLAVALLGDHDILILDEPTNALDEAGLAFLRQMIAELKAKGKTILIASHDRTFLDQVSDHQFKLNNGRLVEAK